MSNQVCWHGHIRSAMTSRQIKLKFSTINKYIETAEKRDVYAILLDLMHINGRTMAMISSLELCANYSIALAQRLSFPAKYVVSNYLRLLQGRM
uniref:MIP08244p n=1 Tax=Drosophila melanogaster TaxID=7227 RepID=C0PV40_DROME|nr:MIP08244p [Drosophila melanogaster]